MKYLNYIKMTLVFVLMMPFLSFAGNEDRDNLKGTYTVQVTGDCVQGGGVNSIEVQITSVGEFTLDGQGGYISRGDDVFIGNGFMGQSDEFCTGAYFVERGRNNVVVNIPQLTCIGKSSQGSQGSTQENPVIFNNFSVDVLDTSLIFQRGGKEAGIYSDILPPETPVNVETIVFTDSGGNITPFDRRCLRTGTFNRKGRFSVLNEPVPAF